MQAMASAMEARMQALEAQSQQLQQRVLQQQVQQQAQGSGAQPERAQMIDTRMLNRPETFDGVTVKWKDWPIVFRAYMGAAVPALVELMRAAEASTAPMINAALEMPAVGPSHQLYFVLVVTCKGQALGIVINAGQGEGLEAWRLLCQRFEPKVHSRQAGLLLSILSWDFTGDVLLRMEALEREIADYEKGGETVSDAMRMGIVLRQLPDGPIRQHLIMNSDRLKTWQEFRDEVCNIKRAQLAVASTATAMDVGALAKDLKGGKAKGNGDKGKSSKDVVCQTCKKKRPSSEGLLAPECQWEATARRGQGPTWRRKGQQQWRRWRP